MFQEVCVCIYYDGELECSRKPFVKEKPVLVLSELILTCVDCSTAAVLVLFW